MRKPWKDPEKLAQARMSSNMVNQIGTELGLSESEIDNLFLAAQGIEA